MAVTDHNVPTSDRSKPIAEPESRLQVETLEANVAEFGVPYIPLRDARQGIVHIVGPELGLSLPGMTIVCGDSHTSRSSMFSLPKRWRKNPRATCSSRSTVHWR
jgi:3-isopropylmalate/(R)-2-methylmalate dehydratase large subunit